MDFKTETQLRQEIGDAWALVDQYKRAAEIYAAERSRVKSLEAIIRWQQFIEDRYEELTLSARRCCRYYGEDQELFSASMSEMDFLIRRHATEIDEMSEEDETK